MNEGKGGGEKMGVKGFFYFIFSFMKIIFDYWLKKVIYPLHTSFLVLFTVLVRGVLNTSLELLPLYLIFKVKKKSLVFFFFLHTLNGLKCERT